MFDEDEEWSYYVHVGWLASVEKTFLHAGVLVFFQIPLSPPATDRYQNVISALHHNITERTEICV